MKLSVVLGTRPEIIKLAPTIKPLTSAFDTEFVYTGQHYNKEMADCFFEQMWGRQPDVDLNLRTSDQQLLGEALGPHLEGSDAVMVYGDTNSTVAGARAAKKLDKFLIHLEAGIRSFDLNMIEERNRVETDDLSDLCLCPSGLSAWFLRTLEKKPEKQVLVVGNTGVDAWKMFAGRQNFAAPSKPYALLTLHRQENVDHHAVLEHILYQLSEIPMQIYWPMHPRVCAKGLPRNIKWLKPLGYFSFVSLLQQADIVLTDSGGVQEEALCARTPCVTIRSGSERQETIFLGVNYLWDPNHRHDLKNVVEKMLKTEFYDAWDIEPYGTGNAALKVVEVLQEFLPHVLLAK